MAWRNTSPMKERFRFVLEVEKGELSTAELCRRYGISRKTGYKWLERYQAEGLEGLEDRSRGPHRSPQQTSGEVEAKVVQERLRHPCWGPKKIRQRLRAQLGQGALPAASTIGEILSRRDLVRSRRRRRRRQPYCRGPLTQAHRPNQVWGVDYKGWFRTGDGIRCDPLTVSDLYSRFVLEARALPDQSYEGARKVFERVFRRYGLPEVIRVDNGGPFASTGAGGLSRLSAWWVLLGIRVEFISRGHPEQNGSHERMHRSLKQEAACPSSANLRAQQRRFHRWRQEFNWERPHEALGQQVPASRYRPSRRRYNGRLRPLRYPDGYQVRRVRTNGEIRWKSRKRFVGEALIGLSVGVAPVMPGWARVYLGPVLLGELYDGDPRGLRPTVGVPPPAPTGQGKL